MVHGNFSIIELCNNNPEVTVQGGRTKGRQSSKVDRDTSFPICNRIKDMKDTMKLPEGNCQVVATTGAVNNGTGIE